ncbi:hypothetical protein BJX61DRAFT_455732 [Aspergillus egyptiacus]|nr:hypothetical protein BJX61DRAFT_455732 [Aspergillus egyptiacus]
MRRYHKNMSTWPRCQQCSCTHLSIENTVPVEQSPETVTYIVLPSFYSVETTTPVDTYHGQNAKQSTYGNSALSTNVRATWMTLNPARKTKRRQVGYLSCTLYFPGPGPSESGPDHDRLFRLPRDVKRELCVLPEAVHRHPGVCTVRSQSSMQALSRHKIITPQSLSGSAGVSAHRLDIP